MLASALFRNVGMVLIHFKLQLAVGGGGGDIGKKINHGGGDGGDDGGDDDDYFDDWDDGDEGDEGGLFRRRKFLEEVGAHISSDYTCEHLLIKLIFSLAQILLLLTLHEVTVSVLSPSFLIENLWMLC